MANDAPTIQLASASPRRRRLLEDAGFDVRVVGTGIDDGRLRPGRVHPDEWTMALAFLKARAGWRSAPDEGVVVGADTMVVRGEELIGQPKDRSDAARILAMLSGGTHSVVTGVGILWRERERVRRFVFADTATVRVGDLDPEAVDEYLASGEWKGKAGAYNLMERVDAGWPIEWDGDPGTIMGLPMSRVTPTLERLVGRTEGDRA